MNEQERNAWIAQHKEAIAAFCQKWQIVEFAFFGSILRDDFGPESDIDVLVTFQPDHPWSLFDHIHMENELEAIFGRSVDMVSRAAIEEDHNSYRRRLILGSANDIPTLITQLEPLIPPEQAPPEEEG